MKELLLKLQEEAQTLKLEGTFAHFKREIESPSNHYEFLYLLCKELQPKLVAELGTHWGVATYFMHKGYPESLIYTVDNNQIQSTNVALYAKKLPGVSFILDTAENAVADIPDDLDLVFADEQKYPESLQSNLDLYYPKLKKGGLLIMDDILGEKYYPDAYKWWTELKGYTKIDLPKVHEGYAFGVIIKE